VHIGSSSRSLSESNTLGVVSEHESWPGEEPEPANGEVDLEEASDEDADAESDDEDTGDGEPELRLAGHDAGELDIPDDVNVLEGESRSTRRGVGIVVSRANVDVANRLLESALAELDRAGVGREQVLVMAVPTAFELPIGAMALAKTRRYVCIVAVGSASDSAVVAAEAASGLQLTALETGVPVAFGLIIDAAEDAVERGAEAVRNALEMADLFQQLRATAQAAK
jgi:6,7-dimethyl-8-ribityllumazine synthase